MRPLERLRKGGSLAPAHLELTPECGSRPMELIQLCRREDSGHERRLQALAELPSP